jgi:hypothetical protein
MNSPAAPSRFYHCRPFTGFERSQANHKRFRILIWWSARLKMMSVLRLNEPLVSTCQDGFRTGADPPSFGCHRFADKRFSKPSSTGTAHR